MDPSRDTLLRTVVALAIAAVIATALIVALLVRTSERAEIRGEIANATCTAAKINSDVLGDLVKRAEKIGSKQIEEGKGPPGSTVHELHEFYDPTIRRIERNLSLPC